MSGHRYSIALCGLICLLVKQTQLPLIPLVWRSGPGRRVWLTAPVVHQQPGQELFPGHTRVELDPACCVLWGSWCQAGPCRPDCA